MEQVKLSRERAAMLANVFEFAEANPNIWANMHGPGEHAEHVYWP